MCVGTALFAVIYRHNMVGVCAYIIFVCEHDYKSLCLLGVFVYKGIDYSQVCLLLYRYIYIQAKISRSSNMKANLFVGIVARLLTEFSPVHADPQTHTDAEAINERNSDIGPLNARRHTHYPHVHDLFLRADRKTIFVHINCCKGRSYSQAAVYRHDLHIPSYMYVFQGDGVYAHEECDRLLSPCVHAHASINISGTIFVD